MVNPATQIVALSLLRAMFLVRLSFVENLSSSLSKFYNRFVGFSSEGGRRHLNNILEINH
jgi:hypothetical protein